MQNTAIQRMLDWTEQHLSEEISLAEMSRAVGYSPYYCSKRFHEVTGASFRQYVAGRRLTRAALMIRDTDCRILDIALACGYSSQEALNHAFADVFGLTPAAYRRAPGPLRLSYARTVLFPIQTQKGEQSMSEFVLTDAGVRITYLPAHRYVGIFEPHANSYLSFWNYHSCDDVVGVVDSMSHVAHPLVVPHTAGWCGQKGADGYCYGFGVDADYDGPIPEGFRVWDIPAGYYLCFYHPRFDFLKDCGEVMQRVENLAWNCDPGAFGCRWDEKERLIYQRHFPEDVGYEVLRPVTRIR